MHNSTSLYSFDSLIGLTWKEIVYLNLKWFKDIDLWMEIGKLFSSINFYMTCYTTFFIQHLKSHVEILVFETRISQKYINENYKMIIETKLKSVILKFYVHFQFLDMMQVRWACVLRNDFHYIVKCNHRIAKYKNLIATLHPDATLTLQLIVFLYS